jgi:cbb3-type cytochrome oxidase subunit 3
MKSKQLKIAGLVTIASYLLLICLYCFHQGSKCHLDARQAEYYVYQLTDNNYDSVRKEMLISERTAIKVADRLFSEKYGIWNALLWKPFDIFLINGYWFVYGPVSKSKFNNGPMIIINNQTGETRLKL